MQIDITDDAFKKHISEAIMLMISQESREGLIGEAIEKLCEKQIIRGYNHNRDTEGPSIMQESFANAIRGIAQDEMNRLIKEDPQIQTAVSGFVKNMLVHVLEDEKFNKSIMETFQHALNERLWG